MLGKHMHWQPSEVMKLPWARRRRALKWLDYVSSHEKSVATAPAGQAPKFDSEGLLDVVWKAPANSNFGV